MDAGQPVKANVVERVATGVLTITMVLLPVLQIVLRATRGRGLPGSGKYVQHAMVWLGFVGALIASRSGHHVGLSTSVFIKNERRKIIALVYSQMVSAVTCVVLTFAAYKVVLANSQGSDTLTGGIPVWWSEVIVPVATALMGLRFMWHTPWFGTPAAESGPRPGAWQGRAVSLGACVLVSVLLWGFFLCCSSCKNY